jgi:hypothetical protein
MCRGKDQGRLSSMIFNSFYPPSGAFFNAFFDIFVQLTIQVDPSKSTDPMKNMNLKSLVPFAAAILIFVALTYGFFSPMLKGKMIFQSDMVQNKGMAKEIVDFREQYNSEPLWTNSMFGGMPSYQIAIKYPGNLMYPVRSVLSLGMPSPALMLFNFMFGFFILLLVLRVNPWLAIVGSIAYAFSAYGIILIAAGHITAAVAMGYFAPCLAGVILICRGKYLIGGAVLGIFMALELLSNHIQNTYYLCILLGIYVLVEWIVRIRRKEFMEIAKSLGVFILAGALALGCNITNIWNTYDYSKATTRGESELTSDKENKTGGLDKDYITMWSMGRTETMTLMIPSFKGISNGVPIKDDKNALKKVDPQFREVVGQSGSYWGDQPFTDAPYSGAIVVFLFVFGMFIVEGRMKWALFAGALLSMFLSWGHNLMWLTDLFLDYFPMYNKFRVPSTMLLIAEFVMPILGVLAVDRIIKEPGLFAKKIKLALIGKEITVQNALFISFGLTGGLALIFYLVPGLCDFSSSNDAQIYDFYNKNNGQEIANKVVENMEIARMAIFRSDALRTFFFVLMAAAAVWMYLKAKLNYGLLIAVLGVLILADLWLVDKRYLDNDNFTDKKIAENPFPLSNASRSILEDKDPDYRVLNLDCGKEGPFNDASTSYYHKSIGGYHAAKMKRYQELISAQISPEISDIARTLNENPTDSALRMAFARQGVLNMLNMRYLIYNREAPPLRNRYALGNAWFVNEIKWVKNADEEIKTIGEVDPAKTVVIDERYKDLAGDFVPKPDPSATIQLKSYKANDLVYESNSASEQLAVFSEIYYKDGWNAYVDGELKPHFGADYVLRAMRVPAGKHTIEFKFEPKNYYTGEKISLASCILLFLMAGTAMFLVWKKNKV